MLYTKYWGNLKWSSDFHVDLTWNDSMGITNSAATIPGIVGPLVAKTIAHKVRKTLKRWSVLKLLKRINFLLQPPPGEQDRDIYRQEWREVFIIAAEIYVFGAAMYIILGKGERQWWAGGSRDDGCLRDQMKNTVVVVQENGHIRNIQGELTP